MTVVADPGENSNRIQNSHVDVKEKQDEKPISAARPGFFCSSLSTRSCFWLQVIVILTVVFTLECFVFVYSAVKCESALSEKWGQIEAATAMNGSTRSAQSRPIQNEKIRLLLIADVHLLGRRRSEIDRVWTDWALRKSYNILLLMHQVDGVLFLGDQLDEGNFANGKNFQAWRNRFESIFRYDEIFRVDLLGNHDAQFGSVSRFENLYGSANRVECFRNMSFVAFDSVHANDQAEFVLRQRATDFLISVDTAVKQCSPHRRPILLTHLPLNRVDDRDCGGEREEAGSVTHKRHDHALVPDVEVLNMQRTHELINSVQPAYVFSAHTHAPCRKVHSTFQTRCQGPNCTNFEMWRPFPVEELTVSTFSWRMRPDTSYGLAEISLNNTADEYGMTSLTVAAASCALPKETMVFVSYIMLGIVFAIGNGSLLVSWLREKIRKRRLRLIARKQQQKQE